MKHLLKAKKGITYLHSMFGALYEMHEPIESMIEFVEKNNGVIQYLTDVNGKSFLASMNHIDLMFDGKKIWHNNYNEEFFNQLDEQRRC